MFGGADAREHQCLRRVDSSARQDDFAIDARPLGLAVLNEFHAYGFAIVEEQLGDVSAGLDLQIRSRKDRFEKSGGGAVAFTVLLSDLEVADAVLRRAVEVFVEFQSGALRGLYESVSQRIDAAQIGDVEFAPHPVKLARSALVVFGFFVVRKDVVVSPAFGAHLTEAVVVAAVGAAVYHRVDRTR